MTLEEFLTTNGMIVVNKINPILDFNLKFEYEHVTPYPYDDTISEYEQDVTEINIDHKTKTITFKGESK